MNYPRKNQIYLKQAYTSLSNQMKFANPKILNTFGKIRRFFIDNFKSKETKNQIKVHLSHHANSHFYNYKTSPRILRQHHVSQSLRKNKDIVIRKLSNNPIQEILSDTSKLKKLNKDPLLKQQSSLQRFLRKLKQQNVLNENVYDKLYPSGSAPV